MEEMSDINSYHLHLHIDCVVHETKHKLMQSTKVFFFENLRVYAEFVAV
jgi:CDP-diacylglycerol pyrophosphatase